VRVRASAPQRAVHPGNRVTLIVDVLPSQNVHLYGPEVRGGYHGLAVAIDPQPWLTVYSARYPPAQRLICGSSPAAPRLELGNLDRVMAIARSPDGKRLASGSWDGIVRIWGLP
jgi:WD40 repeat protein